MVFRHVLHDLNDSFFLSFALSHSAFRLIPFSRSPTIVMFSLQWHSPHHYFALQEIIGLFMLHSLISSLRQDQTNDNPNTKDGICRCIIVSSAFTSGHPIVYYHTIRTTLDYPFVPWQACACFSDSM